MASAAGAESRRQFAAGTGQAGARGKRGGGGKRSAVQAKRSAYSGNRQKQPLYFALK